MIKSYKTQIPFELIAVEQEEGKPFNKVLMKTLLNFLFTLRDPESDFVIGNI